MRLTADLLLRAEQFLNPMKDREIYLRGFKIPMIENLGVLQDQFDSVDLSDNDIKKLDNFPRMNRLTMLLLSNNNISRVASSLGSTQLVNLRSLVMTNNKISSFTEIDNLSTLSKLEALSLIDNPIVQNRYYRMYVIFKLPHLKLLDFMKVKDAERSEAKRFFESSEGIAVIAKSAHDSGSTTRVVSVMTVEQKEYVRQLISAAKSMEEVNSIETQLKDGTLVFPPELMIGPTGGAVIAMGEA